MNALYDSIKARFDATAGTHGITGGLHAEVVLSSPSMPFCEYGIVTGEFAEGYGSSNHQTVVIDFKVVQVGRRAATALAELLAAQFRGVTLSVSGGTHFHVSQLTGAIPMHLGENEVGKQVWQSTVSFEFSVQ